MTIYLSLFGRRTAKLAWTLEALVAKDVRRALGMFGDILISPHIPTSQFTGTILTEGQNPLPEYRIIRALMRGRYRYFSSSRSVYIRNVLHTDDDYNRPSNFMLADLLEYLIRNRKNTIDYGQEGFATLGTVVRVMSQLGYDEQDAWRAIRQLVRWGLVEPESLVVDTLGIDDAIRVHAAGWIHMRFLIERGEYLIGIAPDLRIPSRDSAESIGALFASQHGPSEISLAAQRRVVAGVREILVAEYVRRCRRHAFYEERGFGARTVLEAFQKVLDHLDTRGTLSPFGQRMGRSPRKL